MRWLKELVATAALLGVLRSAFVSCSHNEATVLNTLSTSKIVDTASQVDFPLVDFTIFTSTLQYYFHDTPWDAPDVMSHTTVLVQGDSGSKIAVDVTTPHTTSTDPYDYYGLTPEQRDAAEQYLSKNEGGIGEYKNAVRTEFYKDTDSNVPGDTDPAVAAVVQNTVNSFKAGMRNIIEPFLSNAEKLQFTVYCKAHHYFDDGHVPTEGDLKDVDNYFHEQAVHYHEHDSAEPVVVVKEQGMLILDPSLLPNLGARARHVVQPFRLSFPIKLMLALYDERLKEANDGFNKWLGNPIRQMVHMAKVEFESVKYKTEEIREYLVDVMKGEAKQVAVLCPQYQPRCKDLFQRVVKLYLPGYVPSAPAHVQPDMDAIVPTYDDEGIIVGDGVYEDFLSPLRSTILEPLSPEETVAELDPVKFAGKWAQVYGAAGDENSGKYFCIRTEYKLRPDGKSLDVTNYGDRFIGDTKPSTIRGTASLVSPEHPGIFSLVLYVIDWGFFKLPVKGDYWVVGLGNPDDLDGKMYPWAVVTNPKRNRLYVLARDRDSFDEKYETEVKRVVNRLNLANYYQKTRC